MMELRVDVTECFLVLRPELKNFIRSVHLAAFVVERGVSESCVFGVKTNELISAVNGAFFELVKGVNELFGLGLNLCGFHDGTPKFCDLNAVRRAVKMRV